MKPRDLSSTAVQRAVMKKSAEHPGTVYPLALGALGALGLAAFGVSPAGFIVNGIQIAKTKMSFERLTRSRSGVREYS